jgi:hypothetical protein
MDIIAATTYVLLLTTVLLLFIKIFFSYNDISCPKVTSLAMCDS